MLQVSFYYYLSDYKQIVVIVFYCYILILLIYFCKGEIGSFFYLFFKKYFGIILKGILVDILFIFSFYLFI